MAIEFNLENARALLEMFHCEDELVIAEWMDDHEDGPGLYAYYSEYPDEGSLSLEPLAKKGGEDA